MSVEDLVSDALKASARTGSTAPLAALVVSATLTTMTEAKDCINRLAAENTVLREENNRLRELVACYRSERHAR